MRWKKELEGILLLALFILLSISVYRRYYPVRGVPCVDYRDESINSLTILDLRDYNEKTNHYPIANSFHIPFAYLKRHVYEIPDKPIHVIASDEVGKNLGIRFLRSRGFKVKSYSMADCPCKERRNAKWNTAKKSKTA